MKIQIKVLISFFLLTFGFILAHDLYYVIFDTNEYFFFTLSLLAMVGVLISGVYVFVYEMKLSFVKNNKKIRNNHKKNKDEVMSIRRKETVGEKFADKITAGIGSWKFIIIQSIILIAWMIINVIAWTNSWDPYPFILLNLVLSFQAAYAAPIIMMSQNRTASRDRKKADWDLATDRRAERGIAQIQKDFVRLERKISKISKILEEQNKK